MAMQFLALLAVVGFAGAETKVASVGGNVVLTGEDVIFTIGGPDSSDGSGSGSEEGVHVISAKSIVTDIADLATEVDDSFEAINDSVYQLSMNFREQLQDLRDDVEDDVKESIKTVEGKVDNLSDQSDEREDESIQRDAAMSLELSAVKEELQKAQACGADLKIYTKDGCAVLPPSTAEITTSSKCISSNKGEVGYFKSQGTMCLSVCDGTAYVSSGPVGSGCNPAKSCAEVVAAKLGAGTYTMTDGKNVYCDAYSVDSRIPQNSFHVWYDAEDYDGSTWPARRQGAISAPVTLYGTKPKASTGGTGAHANHQSVQGDTGIHRIRWGNITPKNEWTLCTTSRYDTANGRRKGRIFTGYRNNWLHGHWGGNAGSYYYQGWRRNGGANSNPGKESWLVSCTTSRSDNGVWINQQNGKPKKLVGARSPTRTYEVGTGWGTYSNERSSYMIGTVMSWTRGFTTKEMTDITQYLIDHLGNKA